MTNDGKIVGRRIDLWKKENGNVKPVEKRYVNPDKPEDSSAWEVDGVGSAVLYRTGDIYVPTGCNEMWISCPNEFYNIVYGYGPEPQPIDVSIEIEKRKKLIDNDEEPVSRFPLDVLKYATVRYDTLFKVSNKSGNE